MTLFLDLGDLLTKGELRDAMGRSKRLRFPSVIAHRLLDDVSRSELLLDGTARLERLDDFDPGEYPRTRSFPGAEETLASAAPVKGARFAGWLAVKLGSERQLLGTHPTQDNIDALVRKALIQLDRAGFDCGELEVAPIVDAGAKAEAVLEYARAPRTIELSVHSIRDDRPRRIEAHLSFRPLDAPDCALGALPRELHPERTGPLLLIDVGYLRSKVLVLTDSGVARFESLMDLGVSDCVRRLLRDEQERGLIEDEIAVARALERSHRTIAVAGRRFDIASTLAAARRAAVEELSAAARRIALSHYQAQGTPCKTLAVIGGGAPLLGRELALRLLELDLGLSATWLARDANFTLIEGARQLLR